MGSRLVMDEDGKIDFSGYTSQELQEARSNIHPRKYPKNLANLTAECERRGLNIMEPEAAQPANQPKIKRIENGSWLSVSTWQGGEKAAKQGVWAAVFIAALSIVVSLYSIRVERIVDDLTAAIILFQGLLFIPIAFGMHKRSRVAAVVGLGWYVLIQILEASVAREIPNIIVFILILMLVNGTRGTFALHRIPEPTDVDPANRVRRLQGSE